MPWSPDNQKSSPPLLCRTSLALTLLALIATNITLAAVAVAQSPAFFSQRGAVAFAFEPICALLAYAVAVVFIARICGPYWDSILRAAIVFGLLTGSLEALNVGIENGVPSLVRGPVLAIGFMLITFVLWGTAGFRTARLLRSIRAGLLAAVLSAAFCMLIAVAAGFIVQFFLVPPEPAYVATWAEFKRSGWTSASAFAVANTLDSGFTHLVIAPIVALLFGGIGSLLARFGFSRAAPVSR
jgi:hypothetical protein